MGASALVAGNLALLGIVAYLIRRPKAGFALIWTIASLLPTLSLVPYGHYLADRYLYVPSVGISLLLVLPLVHLSRSSKLYRPTVIGLLGLASLFALGTVRRSAEWDSPEVLWRAQLLRVPDSILARNNLAMVLKGLFIVGIQTQDFQCAWHCRGLQRNASNRKDEGHCCYSLSRLIVAPSTCVRIASTSSFLTRQSPPGSL